MRTILVIENDSMLRKSTCDFLMSEGYDVISAEDGLTGLQQTLSKLPHLILCNVIMPGMNGFEFYKTIQQIKSTSTIPLIYVTVKDEKKDLRAGMELGVDDYITKPFDNNELLYSIKTRFEKLDRILEKNDEKFYTLIDNPLTGVFIYSKNKFDFVNEKCAKIFGLSSAEFSNKEFDDIIVDRDKDRVLKKIELCLSNIQSNLHFKFRAKQFHGKKENEKNTEINVEMYASVINFRGSDSLAGYFSECENENNQLLTLCDDDKKSEILSKKELKIVELVCKGFSSTEIASELKRSIRTIETHRSNILFKTKVKNTAELVIYAMRNHLI